LLSNSGLVAIETNVKHVFVLLVGCAYLRFSPFQTGLRTNQRG